MTWRRPASSAPLPSIRVTCQRRCWLGDLHYRAGRLDEAIATYETVVAALAGRARASEAARRLAKGAGAAQPLPRTPHGALHGALRGLHGRTARASGRRAARGVRTGESARPSASTRRSRLSSCSTPANNSVTSRGWPHGQWRRTTDAFGCRSARRSTQPDELNRVLSHEFVHAVVAMLGGRTVPAWVNEGLATVLEPAGVADAEATLARTDARPALSTAAPELRWFLEARRRNRVRLGGTGRAPLDRSAWRGGRRRAPERSGARCAVCQRLRATNRDALRGFRGARGAPLEPRITRTTPPDKSHGLHGLHGRPRGSSSRDYNVDLNCSACDLSCCINATNSGSCRRPSRVGSRSNSG